MRRFEQAIADFRRIIEISPQSKVAALSHSGIAGALLMQNDYKSAIQEYQAADLPEYVQQYLDNGMCVALSRRALPAAALPYCNLAILGHQEKNVTEFYDARAFALWQLHRTLDVSSDLKVVKRADPRLPDVYDRINQFRTLIVEIFLQEKGYTTGLVDGIYDEITKMAVTAYQTDEGLRITDDITNDLVGSITPLGFGNYRLTAIGEFFAGNLYKWDIVEICKPATMGELTTLQTADQMEYICNSDGESVRPVPNTSVRSIPNASPVELIHPQQLDYSTRKSRDDLRCYNPNTRIVFSPAEKSTYANCGSDSYRISEEDYLKILNGDWPVLKPTLPLRIEYGSREVDEWLRCYDPERNIAFAFDPWFKSCGANSYRISEEDFQRIMEENR
jgi:tetratricopeptide (TPR) repeat protein